MGRRLRKKQDGKNAQSLLQMWWDLWSIARFLNQAHELLKYSRAYLPTPYVLQLISPLDVVRQDLQFTWKKLSVHPAESLTHENLLKTLNYIMYMSGVDPSTVNFFDETSVVKQRHIGVTDIARKAFQQLKSNGTPRTVTTL